MLEIMLVFPQNEKWQREQPEKILPYARIRLTNTAVNKSPEILARVVDHEISAMRYELKDSYPGMDSSTGMISSATAWDDYDGDWHQRPLMVHEHAIVSVVQHTLPWKP